MKIMAPLVALLVSAAVVILLSPLSQKIEPTFLKAAYGLKTFHRSPEILIVAIDERSLGERGPWPWNSKLTGELISKISDAGAQLIAVSSEVAPALVDAEIRTESKNEPTPLVVGFDLLPSLADMPVENEKDPKKALVSNPSAGFEKSFFPSYPFDDSKIYPAVAVRRFNLKPALALRTTEAFFTIIAGPDQMILKQPLAVRFKGSALPSLSVAAVSRWLGFSPLISEDAERKPSGIKIGELIVETDPSVSISLSLRGSAGTFPKISAEDILTGSDAAKALEEKIVIVSVTSGKFASSHVTALGKMDDAEIHANIIDNILRARPLVNYTEGRTATAFISIFVLLFCASVAVFQIKKTIASALAIIAIASAISIVSLFSFSIWFPIITVICAIVAAAIAVIIWRIFYFDIPHKRIKQTLWWRMNVSSMRQVAEKRLDLKNAETHSVTALSFDMRGFGRIAETLSAKLLIEFTSELRALATSMITSHGGFINSWVGDECRAVFGAPLQSDNTAIRACIAALELKKELSSRNDWKKKFGFDSVSIAIGIQSGLVVGGDVGNCFELVGPAIEASSRLSSMSRLYRTWALVGKDAAEIAGDAFEFRSLDKALLYGSDSPEFIFELVGESGTLLPSSRGFAEAMDAYISGDFQKARELFERILKYYPDDGPTRLMHRRSVHLSNHRPARWDGVWRF